MILKELSLYDVSVRNGELVVTSLHFRFRGRRLRPSDAHKTKYWTLVSDSGKRHNVSEGQLRWLLANPNVAICDIDCRACKVAFRNDGKAIPLGQTQANRRYDVFRDYDDALETILVMRDFSLGNVAPLYAFCNERKQAAVHAVARLRGLSPHNVEMVWEDALLKFEAKVRELNVKRIIPLFSLLCQQLRNAVLERRETVRMTDYDECCYFDQKPKEYVQLHLD